MCSDRLEVEARKKLMSSVRSRDTAPELALRRLLTDLGYRYRLQYKAVPGRPDVALPGRHKAIWVHGCFWHQHSNCPKGRPPKSRLEFWIPKLEANRKRDVAVVEEARGLGWDTMIVWECELRSKLDLSERLVKFLERE